MITLRKKHIHRTLMITCLMQICKLLDNSYDHLRHLQDCPMDSIHDFQKGSNLIQSIKNLQFDHGFF